MHNMQDELVITDGSTNISCDEQVQQLQPGQRLLVRPAQQGADQPVFKVGAAPHTAPAWTPYTLGQTTTEQPYLRRNSYCHFMNWLVGWLAG